MTEPKTMPPDRWSHRSWTKLQPYHALVFFSLCEETKSNFNSWMGMGSCRKHEEQIMRAFNAGFPYTDFLMLPRLYVNENQCTPNLVTGSRFLAHHVRPDLCQD
jgi:hypothetical protein